MSVAVTDAPKESKRTNVSKCEEGAHSLFYVIIEQGLTSKLRLHGEQCARARQGSCKSLYKTRGGLQIDGSAIGQQMVDPEALPPTGSICDTAKRAAYPLRQRHALSICGEKDIAPTKSNFLLLVILQLATGAQDRLFAETNIVQLFADNSPLLWLIRRILLTTVLAACLHAGLPYYR
jgi:hypothetical protein